MAAVAVERAGTVQAEPEDEMFDIYDESGKCIGREKRGVVHAKGILHKAAKAFAYRQARVTFQWAKLVWGYLARCPCQVYCFVFNPEGKLLVQKRSAAKNIGPGCWDLSVAEHLSPGETFHQAAVRGLHEELGIAGSVDLCNTPLAPMHRRELVVPGKYYDFEFVQSYKLDGFTGQVAYNTNEVAEVQWVSLPELRADMEASPSRYTQWFREELASLDYFGAAAHS